MSPQYNNKDPGYRDQQPALPRRPEKQLPSIPGQTTGIVDAPSRSDEDTVLVEKVNGMRLNQAPPAYEEPINSAPSGNLPTPGFQNVPQTQYVQAPNESSSSEPSKWKKALGEASYFAGGLISHPYEHTKHYSILRHSHGLVYYKGASTNVAFTVFSDKPLPPDRKLWLQLKGWTGKTGMKVKSLFGANGSWLDVTPSTKADASHIPPADERAWQRDIKKFLEKRPKELRHHQVRETDVIRIPCEAGDGYFRIVLTKGDSMSALCGSPDFRIASTSTDSSSIKGASLSTLPIELGVKILSSTAMNAAGNIVSPITNQIQQYQPGFIEQEAGTMAVDATGVPDKIAAANDQYDQARSVSGGQEGSGPYDAFNRADVVGDLQGPTSPYPIRLESKVVKGTGRSGSELGMPTANLASIPDDVMARLRGVYFGWASVTPREKQDISSEWRQAIISVSTSPWANPSIAPKKSARVYLIHDFQGQQFLDLKIIVFIMGFLRPWMPYEREAYLLETYKDISVTQASLSRPEWTAEAVLDRLLTMKKSRTMSDRYVDVRQQTQRTFDKVPLHRLGVRMGSDMYKDSSVGTGGLCVPRG